MGSWSGVVVTCFTVTWNRCRTTESKHNKLQALAHCPHREVAKAEGQEEQNLNRHWAPPFGSLTIEIMLPRTPEFFGEPHLEGRKDCNLCHPEEEFVSQEAISVLTIQITLQDRLKQRQWRLGDGQYHTLAKTALAVHTPRPLLKPKSPIRTLKRELGRERPLDLCVLPSRATMNKSPLPILLH